MDKDTTPEFDVLGDALDAEFGEAVETPNEVEGTAVDEPEETQTEEIAQTPQEGTDESASGEGEAAVPSKNEHDVDDDPQSLVASKDTIKEALKELDQEKQLFEGTRRTLREEIKEKYYPEGISVEPLVDSENKPITGVADIAGKLLNPRTNEVFTWEEAKDWYDSALQEQKDRISSIEQDIDAYAEVNQSLLDGTNQVMAKYGDLLNSMPEVAKQALDGFRSLMKVDAKTGVITQTPDPVRYYDLVMRPYVEVATQKQLEAQAQAEKEAAEQVKRDADDRADLPIGTDGTSPVKKDALDKAFDEYFKG